MYIESDTYILQKLHVTFYRTVKRLQNHKTLQKIIRGRKKQFHRGCPCVPLLRSDNGSAGQSRT